MLDMAIIGAGPAGLSCGIYAKRGGASLRLFEELFPGGQIVKTHRVDNYPGLFGIEGFELGAKLETHARELGVESDYESITELKLSDESRKIVLAEGEIEVKTLVLCMGASPRKLGLPREEELTGKGVSYCATCDGAFYRDKSVAVIGGGDTAVTDALYLASICEKVYLVHRRDELRTVGALAQAVKASPKVEIVWSHVPAELLGESAVEGLVVKDVKTGETRTLPVTGVFAAVGVVPNTKLVEGQLKLDPGGAIITDEHMQTSVKGVYAAGDVRNTVLRQVVTACADGAVAATSALDFIRANGEA